MDFLVKAKLSTIEGFLFSEKLLVKSNLSTDEGFSTIEWSTIEGFQYISAPICQNTSSSHLVKNESRVLSESLGPPLSSAQTLVTIAGL